MCTTEHTKFQLSINFGGQPFSKPYHNYILNSVLVFCYLFTKIVSGFPYKILFITMLLFAKQTVYQPFNIQLSAPVFFFRVYLRPLLLDQDCLICHEFCIGLQSSYHLHIFLCEVNTTLLHMGLYCAFPKDVLIETCS